MAEDAGEERILETERFPPKGPFDHDRTHRAGVGAPFGRLRRSTPYGVSPRRCLNEPSDEVFLEGRMAEGPADATAADEPSPQLSPVEQIYNRDVAEEELKHGTKYERLTAMVFQTLDADAAITHDVRLRGDGKKSVHQIDVRVTKAGRTRRTRIECRDKEPGHKVDLDEARSFATVVRQLDADGVMVTTFGFTKPAIDLADDEGLELLTLRVFVTADEENRLMSIALTVQAVMPVLDEVKVVPASGEADEITMRLEGATPVSGVGTIATLQDLVLEMMPTPLTDLPEGQQETVRRFEPPLVIHGSDAPVEVAEMRVRYHVEATSFEQTIDAGGKLAELLIQSVDETFDRVIWDADLRRLGFDSVTGDVIEHDSQ